MFVAGVVDLVVMLNVYSNASVVHLSSFTNFEEQLKFPFPCWAFLKYKNVVDREINKNL